MNKNNFIKKNFLVIVLVLIFISLILFLVIREFRASKDIYNDSTLSNEHYELVTKKYEVNEYNDVIISDDDMARIYLNNYLNNMVYDTENSYYLLDEQYRNLKFGNISNYINYVNGLSDVDYTISGYFKKNAGDYIIYGIYDNSGNFYAFKTNGVMQYSVYLDENTIEIW